MRNEASPLEPALRLEINLLFVHRTEIERLPAADKVRNASFCRCRSRFDPGEGSQHVRVVDCGPVSHKPFSVAVYCEPTVRVEQQE